MPEMPAFLANVLEPRFARPARVMEIVDLAPMLRRVRLEGSALQGVAFLPGHEIEVRVSERAFRHYTPSSFDTARGALEIVFYLHGQGPGSSWASALSLGQQVNVLGPGGSLRLQEARRHVFLGDETALGAFVCMARSARGEIVGAIEVDRGNEGWPNAAGLALPAVARVGLRGDALLEWLRAHMPSVESDVCFYLVGHAASIVRLRAALLDGGWSRRSVRTKPYWADGKRGL